MADTSGIVPLSRDEYKALERRAARAEEMIAKLLPQIDALESTIGSAKSAPKQQKQSSADNSLKEFIVAQLKQMDMVNSHVIAGMRQVDPQVVIGAIKSLAAGGQVVDKKHSQTMMALTEEGSAILEKGISPEMELFNAIPEGGISKNDLQGKFDKKFFKIGFGKLMKAKIAKMDQGKIFKTQDSVEDEVLGQLKNLDGLSKNDLKALTRRKLVKKQTVNSINCTKGPRFGESLNELATVTYEDIVKYTDKETGEWTGPPIKQMNLQATSTLPPVGCLHPLMKVRASFRQILLEMGFQEMRTNRYVESCFWNFDSLFQPQAHPARDAHDTFFLTAPDTAPVPKEKNEYFENVRNTHQDGWKTGSKGHGTEWKPSEAEKNILRTHTTAISARTLEALAKLKPFRPGKYFSIDRVFRNETIDATHLAEFHQIEGFVIGKGLTLGHLIGTIAEFFKRIGIPDVKFKPAYNPYTEPSMEIFGWSEERQDFMEVGNSGVFRPEMLLPMGFDEDVSVIAWGLGLERQTMIKYKIGNIRDLFGHQVDLNMCRENPLPYHVI